MEDMTTGSGSDEDLAAKELRAVSIVKAGVIGTIAYLVGRSHGKGEKKKRTGRKKRSR